MDIVLKSVGEIIPYENNPRDNSEAIDKVAESIKRYANFTACTDDICIIRVGERLKFPF